MRTTSARSHARNVLGVLLLTGAMVAGARTAWGQPPITDTEVSTFTESFTDSFFCGGELYVQTLDVRAVVHVTDFQETGAFHLHEIVHGKSVNVPAEGTGPTYRASFRNSDQENIRAVKHGEELVETDTDFFRVVAHGSDGSKVRIAFHAHFTVNANGETTVEFVMDKLICA